VWKVCEMCSMCVQFGFGVVWIAWLNKHKNIELRWLCIYICVCVCTLVCVSMKWSAKRNRRWATGRWRKWRGVVSVLALAVGVVGLLKRYGLVDSKYGARVSLLKVIETRVSLLNNIEETCDVTVRRIHGKLLRYTVPRANGKQSASVSDWITFVNRLKKCCSLVSR
jgi:hypothetical protein